jgi:hypothetical protein
MSIMTALWSISFPIGMVLGLSKYAILVSYASLEADLLGRNTMSHCRSSIRSSSTLPVISGIIMEDVNSRLQSTGSWLV